MRRGCVGAGQVSAKDGQRNENKQGPAENAGNTAGCGIVQQIVMRMPRATVQEMLWQIARGNFRFYAVGIATKASARPGAFSEHVQRLPPDLQTNFHAGVQLAIM